ncbi:hypothetical protein ACIRG5_19120 [Lentzea sp. NPDC102401]|uniref:hypothetical protein n=1 Tax=Lentzea sp. NPDC102401 TaxID=3364128 RepID=UPI00382B2A44
MKTTCSTALRRTLGVAGFLIGFGLLSAGVANADDSDSPGLLGGVTDLVAPATKALAPVTDAVAPVADTLAPVTRGVTAVAGPVVRPVLKAAAPVTEPVLAPLTPMVDAVVLPLSPVLEPLQPVTAPLLTPVVNTVQNVPVVPRITEPLVAQRSVPAEVPPVAGAPPVPAPAVADAHWAPAIAPQTRAVSLPDRVETAMFPQRHQVSAPDMAPLTEVPSPPSPDVPFALPGAMGSVSSAGSTSSAVSDLPARSGVSPDGESLVVSAGHQVHGSWCYYYGRSHPS